MIAMWLMVVSSLGIAVCCYRMAIYHERQAEYWGTMFDKAAKSGNVHADHLHKLRHATRLVSTLDITTIEEGMGWVLIRYNGTTSEEE